MQRVCCQLLTLLLFLTSVKAQTNLPTTVTGPAGATAKKLPGNYFSTPVNFIRTFSPKKPITDTSLVNLSSSKEDVDVLTKYKDSYGRTIQVVAKKASPDSVDFVATSYYDEFENKSIEYLPFVAQTGIKNDGKFKTDAFSQDSSFYHNAFPNEQINYGQSLFDASPLNVPTKNMSPGNSWGGAGVGVTFSHRGNSVSDSVRLWTIAINTDNDIPTSTATYLTGTLTVVSYTDEKGLLALKYMDGLGRVILTKRQISASPSTGHYGWLCTYHVYDEMGHLRFVIPPKAVSLINTSAINWNLTSNPAISNGLCYRYFYDGFGRVLSKYIPSKGRIYLAYDLLGRLVMLQDSNLRVTSQWTFLLYDGQSRVIKTGLITSSTIKDSIQAQAARSTSYPTLTGTYTITSETYYDDYSWVSGSGSGLSASLNSSNINSTNFNTSYNSFPDYPQAIVQSNRIRGSITGTKTIIVNSSTYLFSVNIYDDHTRTIQTSQTNYSTGTDVITVQFGFSGRPLRKLLAHQKAGVNPQSHTLLTKYSYDHAGRLVSLIKNLDNTTDKIIAQNTFTELGQLLNKNIGNGVETQTMSYNIRGSLLGINNAYVTTPNSTSNYFGESLYYDFGFTSNKLDGNIAGLKWKAYGDGISRAYGFSYDNTNRLTTADFSQQNYGSTSWTIDKVDYSVNGLSYDDGGNILSLKQKGLKVGSSATIDSLTYQYFSNSNQLQKVSDGISDMSPLGDFKDSTQTGDDYTYDANGNTNKDYNRHMITATNGPGAVFNFLDKADSISLNGRAGIHYYYDVSGNQLRKQVNDYTPGANPAVKNYVYIAGFVYLNDTLQYILHEGGKIRYAKKVNSTTGAIYYAYEYDYFLQDHLGNVRTVLTEGRDTATYAATMETKDSVVVQALFKNVYDPVRTVFAKPTGFDTDTSNHFVSRLNASTGINAKVGPSLVLKVMAGDKVQISTYAFYNSPVQQPVSGTNILSDILGVLAGSVVNNSGGKLLSTDITNVSSALNPNVTNFLSSGRSFDSTKPKAYLNWILFDDQFNYVSSNSGVQQVLPGNSAQVLSASLQTMSKNGYLYVYVSNESPQDVYFDNLTVKHYTGPLAQEQSFYPIGLQMAGVSDKALLKQNTPYKYDNANELEDAGGLSYYKTFYRNYDPQIGRFTGVDLKSEKTYGISGYHYGANSPCMFNDPDGDLDENNDPYKELFDMLTGEGQFDGMGGGSGGGSSSSSVNNSGSTNGGGGKGGSGYQITPGLVQLLFQLTLQTTDQATNISATETEGGFDISLTAISTGSYAPSIFYTTASILDQLNKAGLDPYGTTGPVDYSGLVYTGSEVLSEVQDLAKAPAIVSKSYLNAVKAAGKMSAMQVLGHVTGFISVSNDLNKAKLAFQNGHTADGIYNAIKGAATIGFMIFGGEEIEIAWNLGTMVIDAITENN